MSLFSSSVKLEEKRGERAMNAVSPVKLCKQVVWSWGSPLLLLFELCRLLPQSDVYAAIISNIISSSWLVCLMATNVSS